MTPTESPIPISDMPGKKGVVGTYSCNPSHPKCAGTAKRRRCWKSRRCRLGCRIVGRTCSCQGGHTVSNRKKAGGRGTGGENSLHPLLVRDVGTGHVGCDVSSDGVTITSSTVRVPTTHPKTHTQHTRDSGQHVRSSQILHRDKLDWEYFLLTTPHPDPRPEYSTL